MKGLDTVCKCLLLIVFVGCNNHQNAGAGHVDDSINTLTQVDSMKVQSKREKEILAEDTTQSISVLILPTRCDYDFALMGYSFIKVLEDNLSKDKDLSVPGFPYKELQGTFYNCVYGKKGCKRILKRRHFDFILMSRYTDGYDVILNNPSDRNKRNYWGYEMKLLNASTMQEFVVMKGQKLQEFSDLEADIMKKTPLLIEKIKTSFKSNQ